MAKTIMVVDGSVSLRMIIAIALRGEGYDVIEGNDGKDALAKLTEQETHLIIGDLNMPNMDGVTFVKNIKQLPSYKFTPVILLTTDMSPEKRKAAQDAGVNAWINKPFQPAEILDVVSKLLAP